MALIKGSKYGKPEEEKREFREEPVFKRTPIIKSETAQSELPQNIPHKKKSRILKSYISTQAEKEEEERKRQEQKEIEFTPMNFHKSVAPEEKGPRKMVMVPANESQAQMMIKRQDTTTVGGVMPPPIREDDFVVKEESSVPHVDVEAIIAEAEMRARQQAEKIIASAQTEAKRLIDQAKIYAETAKTEAHQEGFKLGKEDGYKAGLQEFSGYMQEAKDLYLRIAGERDRVMLELEPKLAELALEIGKKIVGDEIRTNPDFVVGVIKQAMGKMKSRDKITIRVNPEQLEYVKTKRDVFMTLAEGAKELDIMSDPRVDPGGCMIETDLGSTDARISTQLNVIELAFTDISKIKTAQAGG